MLDIRDWRRDLGEFGKIHVRFGKGSRGRGAKTRLVPAINQVGDLLDWWLIDVRHQFGDDYATRTRRCCRASAVTRPPAGAAGSGTRRCATGWPTRSTRSLPAWSGRLTPHTLRHFCASSLYARGMDLKAIQELLGHEWLSTTTRYIHVHADHIERAWANANDRTAARLGEGTR